MAFWHFSLEPCLPTPDPLHSSADEQAIEHDGLNPRSGNYPDISVARCGGNDAEAMAIGTRLVRMYKEEGELFAPLHTNQSG